MPPSEPDQSTQRSALYAGIFLMSMSVLLLQIALTRVFSFTLWYHFAYVTISVALLGYGASGTLVAIYPALATAPIERRLSRYALAAGVATIVGLAIFAELPFHPFEMMTLFFTGGRAKIPVVQYLYVPIFYAAVIAPFFFAGLTISATLTALSQHVSRLYFFDLAGAGVGCFIVVFLMWLVGTPGAVVAAAVLMGASAVMFRAAGGGRGLVAPIAGTVALLIVGVGVLSVVDFAPSPEKFLQLFKNNDPHTRDFGHRWSPIFRTDSFAYSNEEDSRTGSYASWGISPDWKPRAAKEAPKLRCITHDGDAGAVIYNFDGNDLSKLDMFDYTILKTPYLLLDQPNVLVIGVGGGTDIVNAVKNHAHHVTGVELDPVTVDLVRYDHADFAGHLYDRPDVTVIAGEGRSTLRHSHATYDLIQMSGVDTLAALSTGAYVLSENYLYTTDAMREFLDHLSPNGILSVMVADGNLWPAGLPRQTLRQLSIYLAALDARGVEHPEQQIAVIASPEAIAEVSVLLKNSPFTPEDIRLLKDFAANMKFNVWAMPGEQYPTPHSKYLQTPRAERAAFLAKFPLILTPTSDDNPFFFNFYKWRNLGKNLGEIDVGHTLATGQIILLMILGIAVISSVLLIVLPLFAFQRQGLRTEGTWGFLLYFLAIGLGFIFIEISFIQKFVLFLGYPTYSLTVVLFSLLTYSGIGSFLTGRLSGAPEGRLVPLFLALAAVSGAYLLGLPVLFDAFLGSAFPLRVVIASVVLIPLGLVMGMFFPTGIQLVRRANVAFVPWAWGVNGCASVVGTVLAVILAMSWGFRFVAVLALAIYLAGVLGMRAAARQSAG